MTKMRVRLWKWLGIYDLGFTGSGLWLNIAEVVGVRSFQDDKFKSKIVEVDYDTPKVPSRGQLLGRRLSLNSCFQFYTKFS